MSLTHFWGTTAEERAASYPCDQYLDDGHQYFRGIDVDVPSHMLWRWVCQLKVAPYSYDWIDHFGRRSPPFLVEGSDRLEVGQSVMTIFRLVEYEPGVHMTMVLHSKCAVRVFGKIALTYAIRPRGVSGSRLIAKLKVRYPQGPYGLVMQHLLPWGDFIMMRKQFISLKSLVETVANRMFSHNCFQVSRGKIMQTETPASPNRTFPAWATDMLLIASGLPVVATIPYAAVLAYKTYHPPRRAKRWTPAEFNLPATDAKIPLANGMVLNGWVIPAPGAVHTVVLGHGIGRTKSTVLPYAAFLHAAGYNVVAFDLRNHGESSGDRALGSMSRRFTDDVEAVIRYVRGHKDLGVGKIAVFGFSFSTFPVLYVTQREMSAIDAIVCDSGPALDVKATYGRLLKAAPVIAQPFSGPILSRLVCRIYESIANAMLNVRWPPRLEHLPVRLLFIANEEDIIVPPEEIRGIAELNSRAELWVAPGAGHLLAFKQHGDEYKKRVLSFLARAFEKDTA